MPKICQYEGCKNPVFSHNFCRWHQGHRTDKKPKRPNPISEKLASNLKIYKEVRETFLQKHPKCQVGVSGCTKESTQIHHSKGRIGELLIDTKYFIAICYNCHRYVEENPSEAYQKGWSISRY